MKFYSEKTKKLYDSEEQLNNAESALEEATKIKEESRKNLAKRIEVADARYDAAVDAYDKVEKEIDKLIASTKNKIEEMLKEPTAELEAANNERIEAIREFTKKFGAYTKYYSGEIAEKEFIRNFPRFSWLDLFNSFIF